MKRLVPTALASFAILLTACESPKPAAEPPEKAAEPAPTAKPGPVEITEDDLLTFAPLPAEMASKANPLTEEKITLGRMLYFDKRLSKNHDISCNTCHVLAEFGIDPRGDRKVSPGHQGQLGDRNSPTVYNAAGHFAQFWDGRAVDVEEQAKGPVLNPVEMAMPDEARVLATLGSMPEYVEAFKKAFPDDKPALTYDNMGKAIGAFERRLLTPSRFDEFLKGKKDALTEAEKKGLKRFVELGCTTCHNGAYIGATSFQKLGLVEEFPNQKDLGRYRVTEQEGDKMKFKPPSLRNITKTGPYLHDGTVADLGEMVQLMARHQLGKPELPKADVDSILAFFEALTGEIPADYIEEPALPPSTKKTPKPDPS